MYRTYPTKSGVVASEASSPLCGLSRTSVSLSPSPSSTSRDRLLWLLSLGLALDRYDSLGSGRKEHRWLVSSFPTRRNLNNLQVPVFLCKKRTSIYVTAVTDVRHTFEVRCGTGHPDGSRAALAGVLTVNHGWPEGVSPLFPDCGIQRTAAMTDHPLVGGADIGSRRGPTGTARPDSDNSLQSGFGAVALMGPCSNGTGNWKHQTNDVMSCASPGNGLMTATKGSHVTINYK